MKDKRFARRFKSQCFAFWNRHFAFIRKLGISLLTLIMATILIFFVLRLIPGDIIYEYAVRLANERGISFEEARRLAIQILNYDPDASLFQQFFDYVGGLFRGELGQSLYNNAISANVLIREMLPWTLLVSSFALAVSFLLGTTFGSISARKRDSKTDEVISGYIIVSGAVPDYIMGLLLLTWFAFSWGLFPAGGNYDIYVTPGWNLEFIGSVLYYAALPIMSFVLVHTGSWTLMMRGSSIGVLGEDYIFAAKARGLSEKTIIRKYLRRNAMLPLVTSLAIGFATLFGGSALMESIFNYPGLGKALSERIAMKDYFVVQGLMFFSSSMMIFINLLTDSIYSWIDPRVRRGGE